MAELVAGLGPPSHWPKTGPEAALTAAAASGAEAEAREVARQLRLLLDATIDRGIDTPRPEDVAIGSPTDREWWDKLVVPAGQDNWMHHLSGKFNPDTRGMLRARQ